MVEQLAGREWPWASFEVDGWYTKDFGTGFSMWAPGFASRAGERWQIAGALYVVDELTVLVRSLTLIG